MLYCPSLFCRFWQSDYLCTVFFIVLDLRLTKIGTQRSSFFIALMLSGYTLFINSFRYMYAIHVNPFSFSS